MYSKLVVMAQGRKETEHNDLYLSLLCMVLTHVLKKLLLLISLEVFGRRQTHHFLEERHMTIVTTVGSNPISR